MLIEMTKISDKCIEQMKKNQNMVMSAEDMMDFKNATHCSICEEPIDKTEKRCRDDDHLTYFNNRYIPLVMQNRRGYDSHLIIKKAFEINDKIGNRKIDGIPNNNDKIMSFSIGDLRIIDSMHLMQST